MLALEKKHVEKPFHLYNHNKKKQNSKHSVFDLQQRLGNQYLQRLYKSGILQAKLRISHPDDSLEIEARRNEKEISNIPKSESSKSTPLVKTSQKQSVNESTLTVSKHMQNKIYRTGDGFPLDLNTRNFMESKLHSDFSQVRIHDSTQSNALADSINAKAFTVGNDIFFGKNESVKDKDLLAHELTHVAQQNPFTQNYLFRSTNNESNDPETFDQTQTIYSKVTIHETKNLRNDQKRILSQNGQRFYFKRNSELDLIDVDGIWLKLKGTAFYRTNGIEHEVEGKEGFIDRKHTHLKRDTDASDERTNILTDLSTFYHHVNVFLKEWELIGLGQSGAYLDAWNNYERITTAADRQKQSLADLFGFLFTFAGVGVLAYFGKLASNRGKLHETLFEDVEDPIQTTLGEGIDLAQQLTPTDGTALSTNPAQFDNGLSKDFVKIEQHLERKMFAIRTKIEQSQSHFDRPSIRIEAYQFLNNKILSKIKLDSHMSIDFQEMSDEFERGLWANYITRVLRKVSHHVHESRQLGYDRTSTSVSFSRAPEVVRNRFDGLGITEAAGVVWDEWYEEWFSDEDTRALYDWANNFTPDLLQKVEDT